jgi:heptose-I-phosphate ethanolaminephosphotransferase
MPLTMMLVSFVAVLATRAFGNPLEQLLDANILPALRYLVLASLWAGAALVLTLAGELRRAAFYLFVLWLLLSLERLNFGRATLAAALLWTNVLWLALSVELLVASLFNASRRHYPARVFSTVYHGALVCIPLAILVYNKSLGIPLDRDAIYAVFQTNPIEAYEFAGAYFRTTYMVALAALPLLLLANNWRQRAAGPRVRVLAQVALALTLSLAAIYQIPNYATPRLWSLVKSSFVTYRMELAEFRSFRAQRAEGVGQLVATRDGPGETFVVIIGESQSRDHMSAYGYFRRTTPWLEAMSSEDGFLLFLNPYSNHTHTDRVMGLAMTEASQYDDRLHYQSASVIDIANEAGFNTYWITNQVTVGGWDNLVTAIAEAAHGYIGLNRHFGRTTRTNVHDEETIQVLSGVAGEIDRTANNLIFVHLMGNHNLYCERFPQEFAVFEEAGPFVFGSVATAGAVAQRINCYDNSILYTDHVVAGLFEEAHKIDNLAAFIYFADHGQALVAGTGHNSALFQWEMARIPMFAWFSDAHRARRPDRFEQLSRRRDHFLTNDVVYDLLIGVTGIETPHYEPAYDPASDRFDLGLERLTTLHGDRRIVDDPAVAQRQFTSAYPGHRVIAHRVNTLGKLGDGVRAGFEGVELDLLFRRTEGGGYFEPGHDEASRTDGDLESYLAAAGEWGVSRLWLDIKNLEAGNHRFALDEMERLASLHPGLKDMALIESPTRESWFADFRARGWHTSYYLPTEEILGAMRESDAAALDRWGAAIARQVRAQQAAAVSFDARLYPFVRNHLERSLDGRVVYHTWDLSIQAWEPDARRRLEAAPYYRDQRVRTIIVAIDSEYSI